MSDKVHRIAEDVNDSVHRKLDDVIRAVNDQRKVVDDFVNEEPYKAIGIGVLAGLGFSLIVCGLLKRRSNK